MTAIVTMAVMVKFWALMVTMGMSSSYESDLKHMEGMAFKRATWGAKWFRRFHGLSTSSKAHRDYSVVRRLRSWLLTPVLIWPVNLDIIGHHALDQIVAGKPVDREIDLIVRLLADPPPDTIQTLIAQHERELERGCSDHLIQARHKFCLKEEDLKKNSCLLGEWQEINQLCDVKRFKNSRRTVEHPAQKYCEPSTGWDLDWNDDEDRFHAVFKIFCYRWHLSGMSQNQPVLLRARVDFSPFGTSLFIPFYWNLDPHRDFKWVLVNAIHRWRGIGKQGPQLHKEQMKRREVGRQVKMLLEKAKEKGLRGEARDYWVMDQVGWGPGVDTIQVRRYAKYAEEKT